MKKWFFKFCLIKFGAEAMACSLFCNYYNAGGKKKKKQLQENNELI